MCALPQAKLTLFASVDRTHFLGSSITQITKIRNYDITKRYEKETNHKPVNKRKFADYFNRSCTAWWKWSNLIGLFIKSFGNKTTLKLFKWCYSWFFETIYAIKCDLDYSILLQVITLWFAIIIWIINIIYSFLISRFQRQLQLNE